MVRGPALALVLAALAGAGADAARDAASSLSAGAGAGAPFVVGGKGAWDAAYALRPARVRVRCPGARRFSAYIADTAAEAAAMRADASGAACSPAALRASASTAKSDACEVSASPYGDLYVATASTNGRSLGGCVATREYVDAPKYAVGAVTAGVSLIAMAKPLSRSAQARLALGGVAFSATALLLTVVLAARRLSPRSTAVWLALASGGFTTVMRILYGSWLPDAGEVLASSVFAYYVVTTVVLGAMVTHMYMPLPDENARLTVLIEWILRGSGICVCASMLYSRWVLVACVGAGWLLSTTRFGADGFLQALLDAALLHAPAATSSTRVQEAERTAPEAHGADGPLREPRTPVDGDGRDARAAEDDWQNTDLSVAAETQHRGDKNLPGSWARDSSAGGEGAPAREASPMSPLCKRGLIVNMATGKTIGIGKGTYNKLVLQGYVPDKAAGVLPPPDRLR